jgi:CheY-like chemotaxis protein
MESTLIIDDNVDAARILVSLFGQFGEKAIALESGISALSYLHDHIPKLILLDVMMPDMNGVEVLKRIRQDPRLTTVPVILFSGAVTESDSREFAKRCGATEFWVKSYALFANLKQLLAPYLNNPPAEPSSARDAGHGFRKTTARHLTN